MAWSSKEETLMARRLKTIHHTHKGNPLWHLYRYITFLKLFKNTFIIEMMRFCPSLKLKRAIFRHILKMKVGQYSALAFKVVPDLMYPEKITIGDNVIIGYNTTILTHEFLSDALRVGEVKIGNDTLIGANVTILPGVTIGDRVQVGANSIVSKDIPSDTKAMGNPIQIYPL